MKRYIALVLLALCLALLTACGDDEDPVEETPIEDQATATPEPTATPAPTATPEPIQTVAVSKYRYDTVSNSTLQVTFQYPAHWNNDPGKSTICFLEPVAAGDVPARIAVTSKTVSKAPDTTSLKKQLASFAECVQGTYNTFTLGEKIDTDVQVFNTKGLCQSYTARDENNFRITGYILMAYNSGNKHIYVLHFSAPSNRYEDYATVLEKVRLSLAVVK